MDKYSNKNLCFHHALISSVSFRFRTVVFICSKLISRLIRHSESISKYDHVQLFNSLFIYRQYWISNQMHRVCMWMSYSVCVMMLSIILCTRATHTSRISCTVALTHTAWQVLGLQKLWTPICKPLLVNYIILW